MIETLSLPTQLRRRAAGLLQRLGNQWSRRADLRYRNAGGTATGPEFSGRFLADLALGFLALGEVTREARWLERLPGLVEAIAARQDPSGAFRWNLPDPGATHPDGVRDQVDLAIVVDSLSLMLQREALPARWEREARALILRAAAYLETARLPHRPGIIRKRDYDAPGPLRWDVLNGDALAARAFSLSALLPGGERYASMVEPFLQHLRERLGQHLPGWWPYAEHPESGAILPAGDAVPSLFFQSMMIVHLRPLCREPAFTGYLPMLDTACHAVAAAVDQEGAVNPALESRRECRDTPNALVADALRGHAPALAMARLQRIGAEHVTAEGEVTDLHGTPLEDKWRLWLWSDLARLFLTLS
ncbi:MAG TPA: hypothetical protein VNQ90_04015 [Chthoniobacteraceae bacterium]|nr:hypothetical protein [Chthoniobacteraceae bacterium]